MGETEIDPALSPDDGPLHHLYSPGREPEPLPPEPGPEAGAEPEAEAG